MTRLDFQDRPATPLRTRTERRTFIRLAGSAAGLAVFCLAMLGTRVGQASGAAPKQLTVGELFSLRTLDPGRTQEVTALMINKALYDTLVTFHGEDVKTIRPSIATKWSVSADGLSYTFKLRSDVKFTSGNPLTSADAKWSLDRIIHLKATTKFYVKTLDRVEAPDPTTLVIHLKHPDPSLLAKLTTPSLGVVDSKLVMHNGGDAGPDASTKDKAEAYLNAHSAGSGPFILESFITDQEIVLVKNPNYWRGPAKLDRVVFRHISEGTMRELLVKKGDIDLALNISQDQLPALKKAGVTVKSTPIAMIFYIQINQDPAVSNDFANPLVQQAIRYAIDYDGLMTIVGAGAKPLASLMPSIFPGAPDSKEAYKTNPAKARALLKQANVKNPKAEMIFYASWIINGIPIDLIAQKIQSDLAAVGINLVLGPKPNALARAQWRGGKAQLGLFRWVADYADPSNYMGFLPDGSVGKRARWTSESSPEAKELAELGHKAITETNDAKRTEMYEDVERRLAKIGPFIPLFQPAAPVAFNTKVKGITFHSVWSVDFYPVSKDN